MEHWRSALETSRDLWRALCHPSDLHLACVRCTCAAPACAAPSANSANAGPRCHHVCHHALHPSAYRYVKRQAPKRAQNLYPVRHSDTHTHTHTHTHTTLQARQQYLQSALHTQNVKGSKKTHTHTRDLDGAGGLSLLPPVRRRISCGFVCGLKGPEQERNVGIALQMRVTKHTETHTHTYIGTITCSLCIVYAFL